MDKNVVELQGNVTKDIQLQAGGKYCYINIAVNRARGSGADFISVKAFKEVAVSCAESLKKGDRAAVIGHITSSSFTPKGETDKVYRTEIVVDTIRKLPKGGGGYSDGGFIDDTADSAKSA